MHVNYACPIAGALTTLGDRWSVIILRDALFNEKKHFSEFLNFPRKISTNILANRLRMMEKENLLCSRIDAKKIGV